MLSGSHFPGMNQVRRQSRRPLRQVHMIGRHEQAGLVPGFDFEPAWIAILLLWIDFRIVPPFVWFARSFWQAIPAEISCSASDCRCFIFTNSWGEMFCWFPKSLLESLHWTINFLVCSVKAFIWICWWSAVFCRFNIFWFNAAIDSFAWPTNSLDTPLDWSCWSIRNTSFSCIHTTIWLTFSTNTR